MYCSGFSLPISLSTHFTKIWGQYGKMGKSNQYQSSCLITLLWLGAQRPGYLHFPSKPLLRLARPPAGGETKAPKVPFFLTSLSLMGTGSSFGGPLKFKGTPCYHLYDSLWLQHSVSASYCSVIL